MNESAFAQWEQVVEETAATFSYPATPDVAGGVARRLRQEQQAVRSARPLAARPRLVWVLALFLLLIGGLMSVPQVRAAVLQVLRVGAVTIFVTEPTPTVLPTAAVTPLPGAGATVPATATPTANLSPSPAGLTSALHNLAGITTLSQAQAQVAFPLRLPAYPPGLGQPDRVFYQELPNSLVVLLWLQPDRPQEVRLALYLIEGEDFGIKKEVSVVQETTVNDTGAIWVEGEHLLQLQDGRVQPWYFIAGNVLVWFDGQITYRLETGLSLAEAVRIAESLEVTGALEEE